MNLDVTAALVVELRGIVGRRRVLTRPDAMARFCTGRRFGGGEALAVVRPRRLVELWRVAQACLAADTIVILQAANTGLTGGSTPDGGGYDRPVVVISTTRLQGLRLIDGGRQVVCLPGATLYALERALKPVGREPHSVIGSSCIGASVLGGICNNSGGALVRRGPAFTELAVYARVGRDGRLELVNHLGIALPHDPEAALDRLDRGAFTEADVEYDSNKRASDHEYVSHVRDVDASTPARFNADPRRLFEASGSAGRLVLFAARLDTFPRQDRTAVFYVGTNDPAELSALRRALLTEAKTLPIAAEYIHRAALRVAEVYGKDTVAAIRLLGVDRLPALFAIKASVDALGLRLRLGGALSDRLLQRLSQWLPSLLPARMTDFADRFEHHLLLKVEGDGIEETRAYMARVFPSASGDVFECTPQEGEIAFLHRFAVAGAATRYRAVHPDTVEDIVALDIALPRNASAWVETLPDELDTTVLHKLYYGHFLCHVFHQDYLVAKGRDPLTLEHRLWDLLDARGAEYPAEHNVGHVYMAKPDLAGFYRKLDPCNRFNPGIGQTSRLRDWADAADLAGPTSERLYGAEPRVEDQEDRTGAAASALDVPPETPPRVERVLPNEGTDR